MKTNLTALEKKNNNLTKILALLSVKDSLKFILAFIRHTHKITFIGKNYKK